ncbi:hypothetical protein A9Q81_17530 [Gammaproteobacteria bacterium 42_54_T18]|nr:hypothetical protein A9Q81_17530 [Gammaproteobacteria bacterium 42_54_T18]
MPERKKIEIKGEPSQGQSRNLEFVPAKRFKTERSIATLGVIAYNANLMADRERVAAFDGESSYSACVIECQQSLAATAQAEIILRRIFN